MRKIDGLDKLAAQGRDLIARANDLYHDPRAFDQWEQAVAETITSQLPDSGLLSEWHSLERPSFTRYTDGRPVGVAASGFVRIVTARLRWLSNLPGNVYLRTPVEPVKVPDFAEVFADAATPGVKSTPSPYVSTTRLDELRKAPAGQFDTKRLVRLCEELNECHARECLHAVTFCTRAILDHVPPIFGFKSFAEVANNYGGRSVKGSLRHLEDSSRNIADHHLHTQIRATEILPTPQQVNFSQDLEVLLGEAVRVLHEKARSPKP